MDPERSRWRNSRWISEFWEFWGPQGLVHQPNGCVHQKVRNIALEEHKAPPPPLPSPPIYYAYSLGAAKMVQNPHFQFELLLAYVPQRPKGHVASVIRRIIEVGRGQFSHQPPNSKFSKTPKQARFRTPNLCNTLKKEILPFYMKSSQKNDVLEPQARAKDGQQTAILRFWVVGKWWRVRQ